MRPLPTVPLHALLHRLRMTPSPHDTVSAASPHHHHRLVATVSAASPPPPPPRRHRLVASPPPPLLDDGLQALVQRDGALLQIGAARRLHRGGMHGCRGGTRAQSHEARTHHASERRSADALVSQCLRSVHAGSRTCALECGPCAGCSEDAVDSVLDARPACQPRVFSPCVTQQSTASKGIAQCIPASHGTTPPHPPLPAK